MKLSPRQLQRTKANMEAAGLTYLAAYQARARAQISAEFLRRFHQGTIRTSGDFRLALTEIFAASVNPSRADVPELIPVAPLADLQLGIYAVASALAYLSLPQRPPTLGRTASSRAEWFPPTVPLAHFADYGLPATGAVPPQSIGVIAGATDAAAWREVGRRFAASATIPGIKAEKILNAIEDAAHAGVLPSEPVARETFYKNNFTMVRESNQKVIDRVHALIARSTSDKVPTPLGNLLASDSLPMDATNLRLQIENLYEAAGIAPQNPWYTNLVVETGVNRAYQDGYDSISHNADGSAKAWVWGYRWLHGGSKVPRATHLAMDQHFAPKDDPIWKKFGPPPLAFGCTCTRETITQFEAERDGLTARQHGPHMEPVITQDIADRAGLKPQDGDIVGATVSDAAGMLPGQSFQRIRYFIPPRDVLNPTGLLGETIPEAGKNRISTETASQLVRSRIPKRKPGDIPVPPDQPGGFDPRHDTQPYGGFIYSDDGRAPSQ